MKLIEIPEQTPSTEVDEEILEIFVEEVGEVLGEIETSFDAWRSDPSDTESLKTLRRNFHTLKGSGRLVGATIIGELGWRFENMLNRLLDNTFAPNEKVFNLIAQAQAVLPELVEQFSNTMPPSHKTLVLISQTEYLTQTKGKELGEFEADTSTKPSAINETITTDIKESVNILEGSADESLATENLEELPALESVDDELAMSDELADLPTDEPLATESLEELPALESIDDELAMRDELADLPADLSLEMMGDISQLTEDEEERLAEQALLADRVAHHTAIEIEEEDKHFLELEDTETIDPILFNIFKNEAITHLTTLTDSLAFHRANLNAPIEQDVIRAFHTLNGSSRSVDVTSISDIAAPMETYARALAERKLPLSLEGLKIFEEAKQLIEILVNNDTVEPTQQKNLLQKAQIAIKALPPLVASETSVANTNNIGFVPETTEATDEFMAIFLEEAEEILENTQSLIERWKTAPNNLQLLKELQRELHTLKGGARMVGIVPMGDLSHHLESVLTRIVEGNAQSNPKLQEIVQNSVDELAAMLEAVRSGVALDMPVDLISQIQDAVGSDEEEHTVATTIPMPPLTTTATPTVETSSTQKPADALTAEEEEKAERAERESEMTENGEDRIRVRVTLIDKLTNLAGELSISRAHMEQQQGAVKNNLSEMEQTVARLRDQLRRLEIETEAQIISHYSDEMQDDEEFDPLELDRFSVLQQLSRSLMETINDLFNIQDALKILARQSDALLIQQSRIGAELQEGILRTRMVPFSRISPRLQRIARLTARELRKQVEFQIKGESIEFERTVLNRVVAPLEHMLRNAIGHGVEEPQIRQQLGKSPNATIIIDISREGAELIVKVSDDGAGLNLPAIRKKAEERKMIQQGTVISDQELMQFILEPSFSTATKITQVSGRGVGMDVVSTEIKQLGGSLQIHSKTGEGTLFEIRLPLSLTITQALMVHVGEETMAVPLNHVDAVMRAPRQEVLHNADELHYYKYMDNNYRVFHLGELLGIGRNASIDSSLVPMLLVRTGDRRIALLVDGIEGSKEIVVKSVGIQIGTIRWIAGATILGDGRVVLILDIPTITRADTTPQYEQQQKVVEPVIEEKPVTVKTIMVVDDSITVRKVTARLLKRQGMEVLTAKDGVDAIAQLQEHTPDLMLLDVEMPRMDGYELATQVRNNPTWKHIPIIMITSRTGTKHRDRAEKIGINRYLGKPFNETELLDNINTLLAESMATANITH
ncbi:chemotaxis protein histidine kinase-like protein [Beggiatoa alba B18LD]|uniref:Chemotaxis protein CheA n=1 Tax=Beggiatoa alba B18LD TaxID=395493 RepID=I3CJF8_9GAMM|nr:Hpt domain-containing protein [Beggiatoa alba]EIJ43751.1 chemotaxis protein histidine kinase-like protein [Beggiatoa alba B18LD]